MVSPRFGPFQFDTSAESWLGRVENTEGAAWLRHYAALHEIHVSAVTVIERVRGYGLLWRRVEQVRRGTIEADQIAYLRNVGRVWPVDEPLRSWAARLWQSFQMRRHRRDDPTNKRSRGRSVYLAGASMP